jgi:hypothetical protein
VTHGAFCPQASAEDSPKLSVTFVGPCIKKGYISGSVDVGRSDMI